MTTQNLQVFVQSTDVGVVTNPMVMASYPQTRQVPNDTHGPGMSVYILPVEAIQQPTVDTRAPTLVNNWQSMVPVGTMGAFKIESVFSLQAQVTSLHQTVEDTLKYGTDLSKWPLEARQRKADSDIMWKYVDDVNASVRANLASRPYDIASDKAWPI